jgi:hypothetical protein
MRMTVSKFLECRSVINKKRTLLGVDVLEGFVTIQ